MHAKISLFGGQNQNFPGMAPYTKTKSVLFYLIKQERLPTGALKWS